MNDSSGANSTTIDDLDDNMLTQILFRLPSFAPVIACKLVNKRCCSLISDPQFAFHFSNHKKGGTSLSTSGPDIDDGNYELPWTVITPKMIDVNLPCAFNIEATFMDLVLCSGPVISIGGARVYYITNPLTKHWVALPPCPGIIDDWGLKPWVGLVCQQPHDYTQDYKFRVVVIDYSAISAPIATPHARVYKLAVYCSEIGEWKKINLSVPIKTELAAEESVYRECFRGVVCNGIIYLHHKLYLAAFNPFDIGKTTDSTIEAKILPMSPVYKRLRESSGQLCIICTSRGIGHYKKNARAIKLSLDVWKLDPNQVPLVWKQTFKGTCKGNVSRIKSSCPDEIGDYFCGVHPNNDKLIYMLLHDEQQFVLCDTQSRLIKPLKSLRVYDLEKFHRLEFQWWPASVPRLHIPNASE